MAALVLSGARENVQDLATKYEVEVTAKPKLGGAIAAGILVGAVTAFLVGGLAGMSETTTSVLHVGQSSVSAP